MPNFAYLFVSAVYTISLAVTIGGILVLGAIVAPALFRKLDRPVAGEVFGAILGRFARVRMIALAATLIAAAIKFGVWEQAMSAPRYGSWIILRWLALALMATMLLYETARLHPEMERRRSGLADGAEDPRFRQLHRRAEALVRVTLIASVVALILA